MNRTRWHYPLGVLLLLGTAPLDALARICNALCRYRPDLQFLQTLPLAYVDAAGVVRLVDEPGPCLRLETSRGAVLVGGSPDGSPLPRHVERGDAAETVWFTHHSISFPDFQDRTLFPREIPGLDWLVNGHIHRPQPMVVKGATRWCNPGNITRLTFTARTGAFLASGEANGRIRLTDGGGSDSASGCG